MLRLIKNTWLWITGKSNQAANKLAENTEVMGATYDKGIKSRGERVIKVKNAVAGLMVNESELVTKIKQNNEVIESLSSKREVAQSKMQERIHALKEEGKSKSEIESDADFSRYKKDFLSMSQSIKDEQEELDEREERLETYRDKIKGFRAELERMNKEKEKLKDEKQDALASAEMAKQTDEINSVLAGISEDPADKELEAAREAQQRLQAKAKLSSDLASANRDPAEKYSEYEVDNTETELDGLLDWGDNKSE